MSDTALKFFADNPRATAKEAGLTNAEANALVGQSKLVPVGARVTGKRGRPPMEYVIAGTELSDDDFIQEQVQRAQDLVRSNRHFERLSGAIMRAANEYGHNSPQRLEAVANRRDAFPFGPPAIPSKNDYVLAGVIPADAPEPEIPEDAEVDVPVLKAEAA